MSWDFNQKIIKSHESSMKSPSNPMAHLEFFLVKFPVDDGAPLSQVYRPDLGYWRGTQGVAVPEKSASHVGKPLSVGVCHKKTIGNP